MARDPGRVLIFDTTLRDGEQSPGASLNLPSAAPGAGTVARQVEQSAGSTGIHCMATPV